MTIASEKQFSVSVVVNGEPRRPNSGAVCPASNIGVALFAGLFCIWQPAAHAGRFS